MFTNRESPRAVTCTGSPHGCAISPLLYILYTDDCRSNQENSYLVTFGDDSALLSLLLEHKMVTMQPSMTSQN